METMRVKLTFIDEILGTASSDPDWQSNAKDMLRFDWRRN